MDQKKNSALYGRTFSILGDSYSTFKGWIPVHQDAYYPYPESVPDVQCVEQTWWHQLMQRNNMRLLYNDSYSGATVCLNVRPTQPRSAAFVERMHQTLSASGMKGEKPDCIFLFGCTNDSWIDCEIGEVQYENRTEADLFKVLPAYCEMIDYVKRENPQALIISVINDVLKPELQAGMAAAGEHYGIVTVALKNVLKDNGHPNAKGMLQIAEQIEDVCSFL